MVNIYEIFGKVSLNHKFHGTINDPVCVLPGNEQDLGHENLVKTFTKCARCMTLSTLETSLPMYRSHDTLVLDIST